MLRNRQAIVIGPTPPGTGVIAPATLRAESISTSPTTRLRRSGRVIGLMPTSMTVAPGLIQSALTICGRPTAATRTSARLLIAAASRLFEWTIVTVHSAARSSAAIGFPTRLERPSITASAPERASCTVRSRIRQACNWSQGTPEHKHGRDVLLENIDAWDLVMQALPHMWHMSTEEQRHAQDLLQQAIALDPEYAHAHALLGWTYVNMFNLDSGTPIGEFTDQALDAGERAVTLDEQDHWGHLVLGLGHARRRRPETAVMHLSQAVELNPNFALGYAGLGYAFACGGQPERGLEALEQAQRLSPRDPFLAIYAPVVRYMALFALQRYEETIALCRSITTMNPNHAGAWRLMTVSMGLLGRINEAREALARTLALQPDLSSAHVTNDTVYANPSDRARFLLGLQKAGLKN